jgi:hypothetical protein
MAFVRQTIEASLEITLYYEAKQLDRLELLEAMFREGAYPPGLMTLTLDEDRVNFETLTYPGCSGQNKERPLSAFRAAANEITQIILRTWGRPVPAEGPFQ